MYEHLTLDILHEFRLIFIFHLLFVFDETLLVSGLGLRGSAGLVLIQEVAVSLGPRQGRPPGAPQRRGSNSQ